MRLTAPSPARAVRSAGAEGGATLHAGLLGADSAAGDSALARPVASPKASSSIHAVLARGAMLFDAAPALRRGSGDACSTESRAHQNTFDTSEQRPRRRTGRISPTFGPLEPPADASHRLPRRVEPSNAGVGIRARAARGAADKAAASTTSSMRTRPNKRCAGTRTYSSALIPKVNSTSMGLPQFATAALLGGCVVNEATCVACCCSRVSLLKALLEYHAQGLCTC